MTTEEAILALRDDARHADLIRDSYLGPDAIGNAERFTASPEFEAVQELLARPLPGCTILDVGAGTGIASFAFARAGAQRVVALEPDPSDVVGYGALRRVIGRLPIAIVPGVGESMPFRDRQFDVVYARQVLHHARDLDALVAECARVTKTGGVVIATREHVVDDARQLQTFLAAHPVHQLTGGENAYPLHAYRAAFRRAGLAAVQVLGPFDSVVNAFPACRDAESLEHQPGILLASRFGSVGVIAARVPGAKALVRWALRRRRDPGRLCSVVARKP